MAMETVVHLSRDMRLQNWLISRGWQAPDGISTQFLSLVYILYTLVDRSASEIVYPVYPHAKNHW